MHMHCYIQKVCSRVISAGMRALKRCGEMREASTNAGVANEVAWRACRGTCQRLPGHQQSWSSQKPYNRAAHLHMYSKLQFTFRPFATPVKLLPLRLGCLSDNIGEEIMRQSRRSVSAYRQGSAFETPIANFVRRVPAPDQGITSVLTIHAAALWVRLAWTSA